MNVGARLVMVWNRALPSCMDMESSGYAATSLGFSIMKCIIEALLVVGNNPVLKQCGTSDNE